MHIGAFVVCVFGGSGKRHFLLSDGRAFVFSAPGARFQTFRVGFFNLINKLCLFGFVA